jgi:glutamyl-tRNA reductase
VPAVLARLRELPGVQGALVLSTCNRYETYLSTDRSFSRPELAELLGATAGVDPDLVGGALDVHSGDDAVHHLFSVSAGLDSRAPGEGEILGQLRAAAQTAAHVGALDLALTTLVQGAVTAGRRARRTGGTLPAGTSVGSEGVQLVRRRLDGLEDRSVLVVGAGRVAAQSVRALTEGGARAVVAARDPAGAAERFPSYDVVALPLTPAVLLGVDAVVCATSAPGAILSSTTLVAAMALRRGEPLVVVDLAVPRNVEPVPDNPPGLTTLDLDALPGHGRERRSAGFEAAREAVAAETASYLSARAARQSGDLLGAVTARAEEVRREELARVGARLSEAERALLEDVTRRVVGKLLHPALVGIRDLAASGDLTTAHRTAVLLGVPTPEVTESSRIAG